MEPSISFSHIELFAGCGGLSLGLKKAGFNLLLANELSPMAGETFAFNFHNENFALLADQNKLPQHTFWISSQFKELSKRLRENPFTYPKWSPETTDIPTDPTKLNGALLLGNIVELNAVLEENDSLLSFLRSGHNHDGVDLVSGGPPCQSFSMAGLRQKNSDKNTLPWEFANFVAKVHPKIALLENVSGILRPFTDDDGTSFHAWFEVAKVFASKNYVPLCIHTNARFAGVPQNRPRFLMIAIRADIFERLYTTFTKNSSEEQLFSPSKTFWETIQKEPSLVTLQDLPCFDPQKPQHTQLFKGSFLHHLVDQKEISVQEALDDLKIKNPSPPSDYAKSLNKTFAPLLNKKLKLLNNHEHRNNSPLVQRRFRIYQVLQENQDKSLEKDIFAILKGNSDELSNDSWQKIKPFEFLQPDGTLKAFKSKSDLIKYLQEHPTKKRTQKALDKDSPAPAALSIPDDACHYDMQELRVLTVREMARIQSFPDQFTFRSKITTGGQMRKFEVPQYTQVGNAVPPLLGLQIGNSIQELLLRLKKA